MHARGHSQGLGQEGEGLRAIANAKEEKGGNGEKDKGKDKEESDVLSTGRPAFADVRGNLGPASVITRARAKAGSREDWLKDRWQAASDMGGTPIPGAHWVEIDLQRLCHIDSVLIDWEEAYSQHWTIKGKRSDGRCSSAAAAAARNPDSGGLGGGVESDGWVPIARSRDLTRSAERTPKHVIQSIDIPDQLHPTKASAHANVPIKGSSAKNVGNGNGNGNGNKGGSSFDADDCSAPHFDRVRLHIHKPATRFGASIWRLQVKGVEL
jgi:hypothetical protein